jgi:hypothetical protein
MKIEVELSDTAVAGIVKRAGARVRPAEREMIITGDDRRALEAVFKTTITDGTELIKHVRGMATIKIGKVEHTFAPDELARLQMQATFHGNTLEGFIKNMIEEIAGRMLEQV